MAEGLVPCIVRELLHHINLIVSSLSEEDIRDYDHAAYRLDWLYHIMVQLIDQIPQGDQVLSLIQAARDDVMSCLFDDRSHSYFLRRVVSTSSSGLRGRPKYELCDEQLEFLKQCDFKASEMALLLGVSESTIKRRLREIVGNGLAVQAQFAQISDGELDRLVLTQLDSFPNCGYRRMKGLLKSQNYKIQQHRVRECMRRVNPEGVVLRRLELRTVQRRRYHVSGPLALWHIDGNHKLIRYEALFYVGYEISTLRVPIFDEVAIFGFMASLACEYFEMAVYQSCTLINGPKLGLPVNMSCEA